MTNMTQLRTLTPIRTVPIPSDLSRNASTSANVETMPHHGTEFRYRLTDEEQVKLAEYEQEIEFSGNFFATIAIAVFRIHAEKLFRPYRSISRYCEMKWKFTRFDTCRYKKAGEVLLELAGSTSLPTSERQCRELAKLEPGKRREVWELLLSIADERKITVGDIAAVIADPTVQDHSLEQQSLIRLLTRLEIVLRPLSLTPAAAEVVDKLDELAGCIVTALTNTDLKK